MIEFAHGRSRLSQLQTVPVRRDRDKIVFIDPIGESHYLAKGVLKFPRIGPLIKNAPCFGFMLPTHA